MASTTRQALLQALSAAEGAYISGQQLAQQLGVSRAAVHKAAAALTAQGYALEAASRRGYRLLGGDPFCTEAVGPYPAPVQLYDTLESTNRTAKLLALEGAAHGTLVLAGGQTAGRGRLGRSFASPAGSSASFSSMRSSSVSSSSMGSAEAGNALSTSSTAMIRLKNLFMRFPSLQKKRRQKPTRPNFSLSLCSRPSPQPRCPTGSIMADILARVFRQVSPAPVPRLPSFPVTGSLRKGTDSTPTATGYAPDLDRIS